MHTMHTHTEKVLLKLKWSSQGLRVSKAEGAGTQGRPLAGECVVAYEENWCT